MYSTFLMPSEVRATAEEVERQLQLITQRMEMHNQQENFMAAEDCRR